MIDGWFAPGDAPDEGGAPRPSRAQERASRISGCGPTGALEKREARRALREAVQVFARDPSGANALSVERAIEALRLQRLRER